MLLMLLLMPHHTVQLIPLTIIQLVSLRRHQLCPDVNIYRQISSLNAFIVLVTNLKFPNFQSLAAVAHPAAYGAYAHAPLGKF